MSRESKRDRENRERIEALRRELDAKAIEDHVRNGPPAGCGDSSCVVASPDGMATNGGCRCDDHTLRRALRWYRFEFEKRTECDAVRARIDGTGWGDG
jgi:hypothetical protein